MSNPNSVLVCLTTVENQQQGEQLAAILLDHHAAACIQIDGPIQSHYRWQGRTCCENEYRLIIKTAPTQCRRLRELIIRHHPYDQPQVITLESIDVDPGYAKWVAEQAE